LVTKFVGTHGAQYFSRSQILFGHFLEVPVDVFTHLFFGRRDKSEVYRVAE
jgi:hypothetical protein